MDFLFTPTIPTSGLAPCLRCLQKVVEIKCLWCVKEDVVNVNNVKYLVQDNSNRLVVDKSHAYYYQMFLCEGSIFIYTKIYKDKWE